MKIAATTFKTLSSSDWNVAGANAQSLGPYDVVSVGRRRLGEVYRARDPRLKRDVAIKVLARAGTDPVQHQRLLDDPGGEPSTIPISSLSTTSGPRRRPVRRSELVEGTSFRTRRPPRAPPHRESSTSAVQMPMARRAHRRASSTAIQAENVMVTETAGSRFWTSGWHSSADRTGGVRRRDGHSGSSPGTDPN